MLTDAEVDLDMKREYWGLKILKLGGNPDPDLVNSLIQQPKLWDDLKRFVEVARWSRTRGGR